MNILLYKKTIDVLKILLKVDNIEIIKCTIESLLEEMEETLLTEKNSIYNKDKNEISPK